jgi:hypothetical protein
MGARSPRARAKGSLPANWRKLKPSHYSHRWSTQAWEPSARAMRACPRSDIAFKRSLSLPCPMSRCPIHRASNAWRCLRTPAMGTWRLASGSMRHGRDQTRYFWGFWDLHFGRLLEISRSCSTGIRGIPFHLWFRHVMFLHKPDDPAQRGVFGFVIVRFHGLLRDTQRQKVSAAA